MSDYERVKAWREANRKACPGGCGAEVAWDTILCRKCTAAKRSNAAQSLTIAEVKATKKSRWTHHVRWFARQYNKFDKCAVCEYTNHVEVAHIKAVSSFPDTATIREVNDPSNLVGLCPNHHWEFDNGLLTLGG